VASPRKSRDGTLPVQEVLQRREADFAPSFLVVEIPSEAHHRVANWRGPHCPAKARPMPRDATVTGGSRSDKEIGAVPRLGGR
jgi:hypothetical protein